MEYKVLIFILSSLWAISNVEAQSLTKVLAKPITRFIEKYGNEWSMNNYPILFIDIKQEESDYFLSVRFMSLNRYIFISRKQKDEIFLDGGAMCGRQLILRQNKIKNPFNLSMFEVIDDSLQYDELSPENHQRIPILFVECNRKFKVKKIMIDNSPLFKQLLDHERKSGEIVIIRQLVEQKRIN